MTIVFNKIPKWAKVFYAIGFCILGIAMLLFFYFPDWIDSVRVQQLFIGGAIVVVVGSAINTIYQFKGNNSHPDHNHYNDKE